MACGGKFITHPNASMDEVEYVVKSPVMPLVVLAGAKVLTFGKVMLGQVHPCRLKSPVYKFLHRLVQADERLKDEFPSVELSLVDLAAVSRKCDKYFREMMFLCIWKDPSLVRGFLKLNKWSLHAYRRHSLSLRNCKHMLDTVMECAFHTRCMTVMNYVYEMYGNTVESRRNLLMYLKHLGVDTYMSMWIFATFPTEDIRAVWVPQIKSTYMQELITYIPASFLSTCLSCEMEFIRKVIDAGHKPTQIDLYACVENIIDTPGRDVAYHVSRADLILSYLEDARSYPGLKCSSAQGIRYCFDRGLDVSRQVAVDVAIMDNDVECLHMCLNSRSPPIVITDYIITFAAMEGSIACLEYLIEEAPSWNPSSIIEDLTDGYLTPKTEVSVRVILKWCSDRGLPCLVMHLRSRPPQVYFDYDVLGGRAGQEAVERMTF